MRFSLRFTFYRYLPPGPVCREDHAHQRPPVLRLGKVQRSAKARRPFAHNIQPVMPRRLAGFANPDTVIANADAVGAVSRRHAADGNLAGLGVLHRIQHRFTHDLQQMHLFLGIQRQRGEAAVEVQLCLRLAL